MQFRLRSLLIVLALGPPFIALVWWYWKTALVMYLLACLVCPELALLPFIAAFGYGFAGLCHLIAKSPGGNDRKDAIFTASQPTTSTPPTPK